MSQDNEDNLYKIRHSAEHVFAQAVRELYGDKVQLAVAHISDVGFANDAKWDVKLSEANFEKIEKRMQQIIDKDLPIVQKEISREEAKEMFKNNPFKLEWIDQFDAQEKTLTVYWTGDRYVDFCKGPHVKSTGEIKAFKLLSVAGAYWRGDANKEMLTRTYGTAFDSKEALDEYLNMLEEAKKRDHRKLGKELDLFTFSDLVGSGLPLFTPKGTYLWQQLANFSESLQREAGFEQVKIPHITKTELYKVSGHWDKFGDELFIVKSQETDDVFVMKPMNCPHHTQIYASQKRSYRDLPVRYFETTTNYRDEKAGELLGLSRVRALTQDDAHIFCRMDQIDEEFTLIMGMIKKMYAALGLDFKARLSFRDPAHPEKYHGDDASWEDAQKTIEDIAKKLDINYFVAIGEAAFYGPKIDIMVKDSLGREWQCATEQLDFVQPKRFGLVYTDKDGQEKMPVMIHKALLGTVERFMSVYIEHTAGNFPAWLCYNQVALIPISNEKHMDYMDEVAAELKKKGLRVKIMDENETMGNKIRKAQADKIPYMAVAGDKEIENNTVSIRLRGGEDAGTMTIEEFADRVANAITSKSLEL
ncbi:MAG: threonine--tRNA ligase [Candidatus Dojkabacteria bacterium]